MSSTESTTSQIRTLVKVFGVFLCLYLFIVGISGMGEAFKMFGGDFANRMLATTQNPVAALFIGVLATAVVQSSSITTSIIVGMVAGGVLPISAAIPMIMGANIGTTSTAMLVSFGHIGRPQEFQKAFSAALLHLTFNSVAALILFPLELTTGLLSTLAAGAQELFMQAGGMVISNPLKAATGPTIALLKFLLFENAVLLLIVTLVLTYCMLISIVKLLRTLVLKRVESFFDRYLFLNWRRAMTFGFLLTVALQSSSVTTSLAIPLTAAGILKLYQVYPFNLGANVGTTATALLAALATGSEFAIMAAFSHLFFNLFGIVFIWSVPPIRKLPLLSAEKIARVGSHKRLAPVGMYVGVYFILPLLMILLFN